MEANHPTMGLAPRPNSSTLEGQRELHRQLSVASQQQPLLGELADLVESCHAQLSRVDAAHDRALGPAPTREGTGEYSSMASALVERLNILRDRLLLAADRAERIS